MGLFQIRISGNDRTRVETCNAILSANLHEIYPDDWWNPSYSYIDPYVNILDVIPAIRVEYFTEAFYTKYPIPEKPEINTITPAKIAEACEGCHILYPDIDVGYCTINFQIRSNIGL